MLTSSNTSEQFIPVSSHYIQSGADPVMRNLIVLGVLNGLVIGLSHLLYSLYIPLGPGAFLMEFFHQCTENLFISSVYLLMVFKAPHYWPFTLNALIWSIVGLMGGWWPMLPVAVPAGIAADFVIRYAVPARKMKLILLSFAFYTVMLSFASFWPFLFLKHSSMMRRLMTMDPGMAQIVDIITIPFFISQLAAAFVTALIGGSFALKLIVKHFVPAGTVQG